MPFSAARWRARSSIAGVMSMPVACLTCGANAHTTMPPPQATSSTKSSGPASAAATISASAPASAIGAAVLNGVAWRGDLVPMRLLLAGGADSDRVRPVLANGGIRRRYASVPLDWFDEPHGWPERNRRYLATALDLLESATGRALDRAGIAAAEIGAIIVVSTTGIATPSLDALLIDRMRLSPNVQRLPIFGLGCAGGVVRGAPAPAMAAAVPQKA